MLAVLVKDRINIYLYKAKTDQLKEPDYSICISAKQSVVSNQQETNKYVETWDNTLKKYLATDKIKQLDTYLNRGQRVEIIKKN